MGIRDVHLVNQRIGAFEIYMCADWAAHFTAMQAHGRGNGTYDVNPLVRLRRTARRPAPRPTDLALRTDRP
jgi:hypothetical protein